MTADADFESQLADYLAGEMSPERAATFLGAVRGDVPREQRLAELQAALRELQSVVPAWSDADARTGGVMPPSKTPRIVDAARPVSQVNRDAERDRSQRQGSATNLRFAPLLRTAALVAIAFGAGFLARGSFSFGDSDAPDRPPIQGAVEAPGTIPPTLNAGGRDFTEAPSPLGKAYLETARQYPRTSSFSRSLLTIARRS